MHEFRTLASALVPQGPQEQAALTPEPPADVSGSTAARPDDEELALREARFFRAYLREALESALATLLTDIASEIVARELQTTAADVAGIVTAALQRYEFETLLRVRVHPEDAPALDAFELPVQTDSALKRGDAFLDLRQGGIDLTLGARLERVLSAHKP